MITLDSDIEKLSGAGVAMSKKLDKLGIKTVRDLLFYFPFRYDDFSQTTPISKAVAGSRVNIVGQIELIQNKRSPRKRMNITEALINDGSETIRAVWFNQPFIARGLRTGDNVSLSGKVENDYTGLMMQSPSYEKIYLTPAPASSAGQDLSLSRRGSAIHTQGLVPNYHLTQGITQKQIRFFIKQIIGLANATEDWLPEEIKTRLKLLDLGKALAKIHFPKNNNDIKEARERIAFDELFLIQLQSQLIRRDAKSCVSAESPFREKEIKKFVGGLPFQLTNAQRKAAWEILQDISKNKPMSRLLEGDVGSGKTVVAVMAMLNIALNKKQAVLMVPTEILAQQHFNSVCKLLKGFDIKIGIVTRSIKKLNNELGIMNQEFSAKKNKKIHNSLFIIHNSQIIIGTHALIQEKVEFKNLALAVIDEQHRFGVEQRKALILKSGDKNIIPHFLSMTATPIPRSLALALYGDLDLSIIDEMPKGRKKIQTFVVPENKRQDGYKFIRKQIESGRQVFVICPLIDFSDKLGVRSVKEEFKKLNENIFPDLQIGFLHGRMKSAEKEKIMQEFLDNKIKILVSTSVVEVGIDVPNATIMMIEGADRFGLAQLHQFRGRVGRSDHQSYCFLFSDSEADRSIKRLQALTNCYDGFELAKTDLKFRGPGEVYGTAQKGFPELKVASLFDYQLMKQARDEAIKLINKDANLKDWPELKNKLGQLENSAHLE
ncbi:ATP-dependent DNA helicase RecG [Patescibacteria group bacterium]|nr:ATP-dependent DNA helicase RecG [Candidatus Falkowbacteria bacterium]MBU3906511.1 ATP-dependent DNA helicase RecG [Patescibacteria group bacterium]MBU4014905.1 ATP-dependent DNA helicase RecG [Patescibacteria group bacterium]MBU4026924.1 ATP-dependent DNA helicase RecG [Patescibacteria group bacterium]MBU4073650.1 ATP-dependent DNA helicase RecG [Patescibacteria group bacterium]